MRHRIAPLLMVAMTLILLPALWAHAKLVRSDPTAGTVVKVPPQVVRAWFNEELDPRGSAMSVWDAATRRVDDGQGGVDLDDLDRKSMLARVRTLGNGVYTVRWRAVSADDGFIAEGRFTFTVRR